MFVFFVVEVWGLFKSYGWVNVLIDVFLNVILGEVYVLIGFNGVGKIILICMLIGFVFFMWGEVCIMGVNVYIDGFWVWVLMGVVVEVLVKFYL